MLLRVSVCLVLLASVASVQSRIIPSATAERSAVWLLANLSSLWDEVHQIRQELDFHLHNGLQHREMDLSEALNEINDLEHEHHVHHLKHPHVGHSEHHRGEILHHLEKSHGHGYHPSYTGEKQDSGEHSGEHDSEEDHGSHGHGHQHGSSHHHSGPDTHDLHGFNLERHTHVKHDSEFYEPNHQDHKWVHASCQLQSNSDLPDSQVFGRVDISQKSDEGPVFFDVDVHGFDVAQSGNKYSIEVHEGSVQGQQCGTVGERVHPGAIGDQTLDEFGMLDHVISSSSDVAFNDLMGKSIVVHSLGHGDPASSLNEAHLACCSVRRLMGSTRPPVRPGQDGHGRQPMMPGQDGHGLPPMMPGQDGHGLPPMMPGRDGHGLPPMMPGQHGHGIRHIMPGQHGHGIRRIMPGQDGHGVKPIMPGQDGHGLPPIKPGQDGHGVHHRHH